MKAIRFHQFGAPEVLRFEQAPSPTPGRGEVLVRVRAAAVNPKDCFVRKGKFRWLTGRRFPQLLGHDFAGEVKELGAGVGEFRVGDAVYGMLPPWRTGAYAEELAVSSKHLAAAPAGLSFVQAAAIPLAALTALQALRDLGRVQSTDRVCLNGASGGVGTFAVQLASTFGAHVTAVCSERNAELCTRLGAADVIDYQHQDVARSERRFDLFFDVFGNRSFREIRRVLEPGGVYVTTIFGPRALVRDWASRLTSKRRSRLVLVRSSRADLELLARYVEQGRMMPVVDRVLPLGDAAEAHEYVQTKRARGKVVLAVDRPKRPIWLA